VLNYKRQFLVAKNYKYVFSFNAHFSSSSEWGGYKWPIVAVVELSNNKKADLQEWLVQRGPLA
jgi:hypothetical protein